MLREIVEAYGIVRMILAKGRLADLQRLPVKRLRLRGPTRGLKKPREIVEALGIVRMLLAEGRRADFQRLPVKRLRVSVPISGLERSSARLLRFMA